MSEQSSTAPPAADGLAPLARRQVRLRMLGLAGAAVLLLAAIGVLHHELARISLRAVLGEMRDHTPAQLFLAVGFTLLSYLAMSGYDVLAVRQAGAALRAGTVVPISLIANAIGQTVGFAIVSGGAIRYRMYAALGIAATDVARIIAFVSATFALGVVTLTALLFVVDTAAAARLLHLPTGAVGMLGASLLAPLAAYLVLRLRGRTTLGLGAVRLPLPTPPMLAAQVGLAVLDLAAAAAVLHVLLPASAAPAFGTVLLAFVCAIVAGIASHVPGGLGVFEGVLVLALPTVPRDALLGAVLAYRGIYYLLPFALAALGVGAFELRRLPLQAGAHLRHTRDSVASAAPLVLAAAVFAAGAMLVWSGALPTAATRHALLERYLALPVVEVSHLAGSLLGVGLMVLARGLARRSALAWRMVSAALLLGVAASLARGMDWEEALVLALLATLLAASRREFHRGRDEALLEPGAGWLGTVALVVAGGAWLVLFAYRHVEYSDDLWWQFAFDAHAPRSLRAGLATALAVTSLALLRLWRPRAPRTQAADPATLARVRPLLQASAEPAAALALLGDKAFLVDADERAFLMYQVHGRTWVSMGGAVGDARAGEELAWRFVEMAEHYGGRAAFYQVPDTALHTYVDMGLDTYKLGEEALVALEGFTLDGAARAGLRQAHRRAEREGATFELVPRSAVPALLPELENVSNAWLDDKHTREKGFALGRFEPAYLCEFPCAVVRVDGAVVAFANLWAAADRGELSIDLMRHARGAPRGVMDYLFIELMLWGAANGYGWFNLGMAPLSGLERHRLAPLWHRFGTAVFHHGEYFYNFAGLRAYKQKFSPTWRSRYLATRGGTTLPLVLIDVAALIGGGLGGVVRR